MRKLSTKWKIGLILAALFVAGICALVGIKLSVKLYYIPSRAMAPTLRPNDHVLVNNLAYLGSDPKRGDIVVFRAPTSASPDGVERVFVKRVIAVPGDTLRITPGYVRIGTELMNHWQLKQLLQELSKVEIRDGGVYEDGKEVANSELAELFQVHSGLVEVVDGKVTDGRSTYDLDELRDRLASRHLVELADGQIYRDGRPVDQAKLFAHMHKAGAMVRIVPGVVYLNDKALREPYTAEDSDMPYPMPNTPAELIVKEHGLGFVKVPPGKLIVMGDNRNDSNDSRFWGPLDRRRVLGKVIRIVYLDGGSRPVE